MSMLIGNTLWKNKLGKVLACLCLLFCILWGYHRYMNGNIVISNDIQNRIEQTQIADNWTKLLALGFDKENYSEGSNYSVLLTAQPKVFRDFGVDQVQIIIRSSSTSVLFHTEGSYHRVGLYNAIRGLGTWGECTSRLSIETPECLIYLVDYESDGTEKSFELTLQKIYDQLQ